VAGGRGRTRVRMGATRARFSAALSRLGVLIGALALFGQVLALPYHHPQGRTDPAEVVAFLKATFGDAAALCVSGDDSSGSGTPSREHDHGGGDCPLCQFGAQTVLFSVPPPTLPLRIDVAIARLSGRVEFVEAIVKPRGLAQPRAPPLEV